MKIERMLHLAKLESYKSTYHQPIGAIFINGNKILSRGYNQIRYKSTGSRAFSTYESSLHAERDCLSKLAKERIRGGVLVLYRRYKDDSSALSRPCNQCMWMLEELGVRRVIYSTAVYPYYEIIKI